MAGQLGADPTYLGWLRALGFEENTTRDQATVSKEKIAREAAFTAPQIAEQGERTLRNVSAGMEDRGLFRSGEALRRGAETRAATVADLTGLHMRTGDTIAGIESTLSRQLAEIERRRAEQALTTGGERYLSEGLVPYRNYNAS